MKADLSAHLECMDHEISGIDTQIEHQAYRVDGRAGIKSVVGLSQRKSIDYFYIKNDHCIFIEFSDLARSREDILGLDSIIENMEESFHRGYLEKLIKNDHRDEMTTKFKDSKDIFIKIPDYFQSPPRAFLSHDAKTFYIVYAPIKESLPEANKAEIARYLTLLEARISDCLEDEICNRVKLILLGEFIKGLT